MQWCFPLAQDEVQVVRHNHICEQFNIAAVNLFPYDAHQRGAERRCEERLAAVYTCGHVKCGPAEVGADSSAHARESACHDWAMV